MTALLVRSSRARRFRSVINGERPSLAELEPILEEWHELNAAGTTQFHIEARRTTGANPKIELGWTGKPRRRPTGGARPTSPRP